MKNIEQDAWVKFCKTGAIHDYLNFRSTVENRGEIQQNSYSSPTITQNISIQEKDI